MEHDECVASNMIMFDLIEAHGYGRFRMMNSEQSRSRWWRSLSTLIETSARTNLVFTCWNQRISTFSLAASCTKNIGEQMHLAQIRMSQCKVIYIWGALCVKKEGNLNPYFCDMYKYPLIFIYIYIYIYIYNYIYIYPLILMYIRWYLLYISWYILNVNWYI